MCVCMRERKRETVLGSVCEKARMSVGGVCVRVIVSWSVYECEQKHWGSV